MAPTLKQLAVHLGSAEMVVNEVAFIVDEGMKWFAANRQMPPGQIAIFSSEVARTYQHESLADVHAFMIGAAMSKYDDGEYYANVDIPRLSKWWRAYLAEKAEARENAERDLRNQRQRETEQALGNIPGLADTVKAAVLDNEERKYEDARRRRMARLALQFKFMTDEDLRASYVKYKDADTRSVILEQAKERGLLSASMNEAVRRGEEEARAEAQHLTDHPEELPAIPEPPSTQVA